MAAWKGGMTSWQKTLYIMFSAQFLSAVGFSMIFPFLPGFVASLGSVLGLGVVFLAGAVFSAQAVTMAIASPIWGALADRFGKKLMVQRAMFGGAFIILLMGFSSSAEMLVVLRAIQGLITGTVAAANALVAATAPRERTGYAMGVLQVGLWSGVALGPLLGGVMADTLGYRMAFFVTAALLFAGGLLVQFGVDEGDARPLNTRKPRGILSEWRHVLTSPGVPLIFLFRFLAWLGRNVIVPYLPLFVATLLVTQTSVNTLTGLTIALSSGAGTISALLLGRLGDRIGHRQILLTCAVVAGLVYLLQAWAATLWQLLILQVLIGAAAGGVMPVLSALLNHYTEPGEEGAAYGFDNSVVSLSRALAPMLGAALIFLGDFRALFIAAGLLFLLSALLAYWFLPNPKLARPMPSPVLGD